MNDIQSLISSYALHASRHGELLIKGDSESNNAVVDALAETVQRLKRITGGDISALKVLLDHDDVNVRRSAASELLWTCEEEAVDVLERIGDTEGMTGLIAETVLEEWRAGRLQPP